MAKNPNLRFTQYDCAKDTEEPPYHLDECGAVLHMVGTLRSNNSFARVMGVLSDLYLENKKNELTRSSWGKAKDTKASKEMEMLRSMLHIFFLSSHYYLKAQVKRSEMQIEQTYGTTINMAK